MDKEFWLKVKEEYSPKNDILFICCHSPTFKRAWEDERLGGFIRSRARRFLDEVSNNLFYVHDDSDILFETYNVTLGWIIEKQKIVRVDFINWCIECEE